MFFQIEDICAQETDEAIRRIIRSLPRDLPATYQRALERVVRNRKADVARKMFRWVAAAKRPLSLMEIRGAIAVEPCQPFSQQDKLVNDVDQLVPWCGNLLVLDEEEGLVQFAHHSVKDYLLSGEIPRISSHHFRINLHDVDREAGEICCTYLNFSDFEREVVHFPQVPSGLEPKAIVETSLSASSSPTLTSSLLRLNNLRKVRRVTEDSALWRQLHLTSLKVAKMWPQNLQTRYYFLAYASEYWLHHTSNFKEENQCWSLFRRLVFSEKITLATRPWSIEEWKAFNAKVQNYILKTEHRGLLSLVVLEQLIYARADLCRVISDKFSPQRSDELFQFHVDTTRMVEDFWSTWDPVLIIAAGRGRLDLVEKVCELTGGSESNLALQAAKYFNSAPAHMDASLTGSWNSAWRRAKHEGTCEMLDLLLTYNATMLGKLEERGYEELHAAALTGDLLFTRRLLDAGVNPNVTPQSPSFDSILAAGASGGSLEVVELLLHAGAYVNLQTVGLRETALLAAIRQGKLLVVIALLAAGADVNVDWDVNALTDSDVNVAWGVPSLTPLAAAGNQEGVMVLLLLAGARFEGLARWYQLQNKFTSGSDKQIERVKRRAYLQYNTDMKLMTAYYRANSSFPAKKGEFFHGLKDHVKYACRTEIGPIKVEEAVEEFLNSRLEFVRESERWSLEK